MAAIQIAIEPTTDIQAWIDQVQAPSPLGSVKRRCPLQEITTSAVNAMDTGSPAKRRRRVGVQEPMTQMPTRSPSRRNNVMDPMDDTPRTVTAPSLPPSRSSTTSSRATSPVKITRMKNIQGGMGYTMINVADVAASKVHTLRPIVGLLERLDAFCEGQGVLPQSCDNPNYRRHLKHPHYYDETGERGALGQAPCTEEVQQIMSDTRTCEVEQDHESGWNCTVHWPLARLALQHSAHVKSLMLRSLTVARIEPATLVPSHGSGFKLGSKMIDLAYTLASNPILEAGFANLDIEPDSPCESYNHTCLNTVLDKPIAISIETKSGAKSVDSALPQLLVWVHAHFSKLTQLTSKARDRPPDAALEALPPLLLIVICGAMWTFLVATHDTEGKLTLWRCPSSLDTKTVLGVYQVVAALQLALDWAEKQYRPWFEANAVPLTPEEHEKIGRPSFVAQVSRS